jgi:hypothetical protein
MTFVIKIRGARGNIVAEYECPEHGRFAATVQRDDAGDAPSSERCPVIEDETACGLSSEYRISAVIGRVRAGEVSRGKSAEVPHHLALDTRDLADGMPYNEWKKKRSKVWRDETRKRRRDAGLA